MVLSDTQQCTTSNTKQYTRSLFRILALAFGGRNLAIGQRKLDMATFTFWGGGGGAHKPVMRANTLGIYCDYTTCILGRMVGWVYYTWGLRAWMGLGLSLHGWENMMRDEMYFCANSKSFMTENGEVVAVAMQRIGEERIVERGNNF
ncbi:hypothetical protein EYC80_001852 [Monilinia laxa]|uniref:Uncharacterized protein n=1 Tax=Monilinia laxa TaxID=61186 RepID=A0A5N6K6C6_MONLA|nr:hypothetical protein EYC80_001852 [Monilinia laxa]